MAEEHAMPIRSVWMITREYDGLAGAGGVKDVCRQLAEVLVHKAGCRVRVILPRYGLVNAVEMGFTPLPVVQQEDRIGGRRYEHVFSVDMNYIGEERREKVAIWQGEVHGVGVYLIEADRFATKRGVYTYTEEDEQEVAWQHRGGGHFDYFAMNILLQKTALELMVLLDEHPDIIHCHDGHAATLPAIMRELPGYRSYFRSSAAVVTIHNAGLGYHQEVHDLEFAHAITGLSKDVIHASCLAQKFDPFLAAASYAPLNTVSENYARELQETAEDARTGWLGHALLDRGIRLAGITNGIDPKAFDPRQPERLGLDAAYNVETGELAGKKICKTRLLQQLSGQHIWPQIKKFGGLIDAPDLPLFTFIGRLALQKGVDILTQAISIFLAENQDAQFLFLGSGETEFEQQVERLANSAEAQGRVCYLKGYGPELANRIYAAGDFFLIPSRYEPCGLTDYIAQLLGNLPIVHRVGGLIKVLDGETGFAYNNNIPSALATVLWQAKQLYIQEPQRIRTMQMAALARILERHTWEKVMDSYLRLYQEAMRRLD